VTGYNRRVRKKMRTMVIKQQKKDKTTCVQETRDTWRERCVKVRRG
jgi:hypothetical protein